MQILQTQRLIIRPVEANDAAFMYGLYNQPAFLQHVGDRGLHDIPSTVVYIDQTLKKLYAQGYGVCLVELKSTGEPIGTCGLLKRDYLPEFDLGYALMSEFEGKGYAYEAAKACLDYAFETLGKRAVLAMTSLDNTRSIGLLKKLQFTLEKQDRDEAGKPFLRFRREFDQLS